MKDSSADQLTHDEVRRLAGRKILHAVKHDSHGAAYDLFLDDGSCLSITMSDYTHDLFCRFLTPEELAAANERTSSPAGGHIPVNISRYMAKGTIRIMDGVIYADSWDTIRAEIAASNSQRKDENK